MLRTPKSSIAWPQTIQSIPQIIAHDCTIQPGIEKILQGEFIEFYVLQIRTTQIHTQHHDHS
jgi:hypothetical protein